MRGERSEHPTPPFSYLDYLDLREHLQSFSGLLAYHDDFMSLTGTDKPERIYGALTSANYFDVLGVHPILGRGFLPAEEQRRGGGSVAVISEGMWRARFGSDRSIIGQRLRSTGTCTRSSESLPRISRDARRVCARTCGFPWGWTHSFGAGIAPRIAALSG